MYGSRCVTIKMGRSLSWALTNSRKRLAVHGVSSFSRRIRASSLADCRAWRKLFVTFEISPASGLKKLELDAVSISELPLRTACRDSTILEIEWKKTHR